MGTFLFGLIILVLYFLPSIVGYNKRNANSICVLNLFLGWTFIGWVVAMVWATTKEKENPLIVQPQQKINISQELKELKYLLDDGLITQDDFEEQKAKILSA